MKSLAIFAALTVGLLLLSLNPQPVAAKGNIDKKAQKEAWGEAENFLKRDKEAVDEVVDALEKLKGLLDHDLALELLKYFDECDRAWDAASGDKNAPKEAKGRPKQAYKIANQILECIKTMDDPEEVAKFEEDINNRDDFSLRPRMAMVYGLILVTFGKNTPPIDDYLEGLHEHIAEALGGDGRLRLLGYQKVILKANWKTYADNCTYHAGLLHTAFQMLDWQGGKGYQLANNRGHRVYVGELTFPKSVGRLNDPSLLEFRSGSDPKRGSVSVRLFPISGMTKHMDSMAIRFGNPLAVDLTEVHYTYFAHADDDEELVRHRVRQASNSDASVPVMKH